MNLLTTELDVFCSEIFSLCVCIQDYRVLFKNFRFLFVKRLTKIKASTNMVKLAELVVFRVFFGDINCLQW